MKFKVGDKVKCINKDCNPISRLEIGKVYTVSNTRHDSSIKLEELKESCWWTETQFELAIEFAPPVLRYEYLALGGCQVCRARDLQQPYIVEGQLNKLTGSLEPKKGFMANIIDKIKNLALDANTAALRRAGFEDENGNMTYQAIEYVGELMRQAKWKEVREEVATNVIKIEADEK